jgi:hypothetical protein
VHHLLGLWALGATSEEIENLYQYNTRYQIPIVKPKRALSETPDMRDPEVFNKCLGSDDYYSDFMKFFEEEIDAKGVPAVIREYLLKGDERANDIFYRMYTGDLYMNMKFERLISLTTSRSRSSHNPPRMCPRVQPAQSRCRSPRSSLCPRKLAQGIP